MLSWPDSPWQLPCALSSPGPSVPSRLYPHPGYYPSQPQLGCLPGPLPALTHSLWSWPHLGPWFRPGVLGGGQPALLLRKAFQSWVGGSWWLVQVEGAPQALVSQVATWGHHFTRHAALPPAKQGQGATGRRRQGDGGPHSAERTRTGLQPSNGRNLRWLHPVDVTLQGLLSGGPAGRTGH